LTCGLAATPALAAERHWADVEVRHWDAEVSGEALVRDQGIGTLIDLERDLGLAGDEVLEGRLLFFPTHSFFLRLAYVPLDLAGDRPITQPIEFGGEAFDANVRVVSGLDLEYGRFHVGWMFRTASGRFRVGPMIGAAGLRGDAKLRAPDLPFPIEATEEFEGAFGSLGVLIEGEPISRLELFAEVSQLVGVDEGDVSDFEAGARIRLVGELRLVVAVRTLAIDFEEDDDRLEADIEGLSVGLSMRF
jgi:hypothetical protein